MQWWSQALPTRLHRGAGWPTTCIAKADTTRSDALISLEGLTPARSVFAGAEGCIVHSRMLVAFRVSRRICQGRYKLGINSANSIFYSVDAAIKRAP
jgi:hypothetical protein